jgi:hypothetical protein
MFGLPLAPLRPSPFALQTSNFSTIPYDWNKPQFFRYLQSLRNRFVETEGNKLESSLEFFPSNLNSAGRSCCCSQEGFWVGVALSVPQGNRGIIKK